MKARIGAGALLAVAVAAGAISARAAEKLDTAPRHLLTAAQQAAWKGVGRLNTGAYDNWAHNAGAYGYCTATLMSQTLALTAAHCLFDEDRRRRVDTELYFAAGWRDGQYQSIRRARRTAVHPDYVPGGRRATLAQIAADVALVELDQPVLTTDIPNYEPAPMPDVGAPVALLSYGKGRDNVLSMQEPCRIRERRQSVARLSCDVAPGSSGSPVFTMENGRPQVVAVISAYSVQGSYAVVLEDVMPKLLDALAGKSAARKVTSAPETGLTVSSGLLPKGGAWTSIKPPKN